MAGYSGTPLAKKLGIKPGSRLRTIGAPQEYRHWLEPLPPHVSLHTGYGGGQCELVHLFVTSLDELDRELPKARSTILADGAIWVSWQKKASRAATDVSENVVRTRALQSDLVDVNVCAVSNVWSGLKLVVRKHLR